MSLKGKLGTGAVMAVLLLGTYVVAQLATGEARERPAHVTVSWGGKAGVVLVVRIAGKYYVGGATFTKSPFEETYDVRPGDSILVAIDPVIPGTQMQCSIAVSGMPPVTNASASHFTCLTTVT